LILVIYGGWLALTWCWQGLPLWVVLPAGAWLSAWHMSLQHELIHGHPTRHHGVNHAIGWPPLNLWLPYAIYRESHLRHHRTAHLTDPLEDPESTYMSAAAWARAGAWRRRLHGVCNTLAGRVLLGPPWAVARFWRQQVQAPAPVGVWLGHAAGAGLVLFWVWRVCGIDPLAYGACFVYPGTALTMIRSLAEHRAAARPQDRTSVVEPGGLLGVLFLYNNLHVLHHEFPAIPWYEMKARWRVARLHLLAGRHGPVYRGYREVAARHGLRPLHAGPHPDGCDTRRT
jgi:fatty acid desaturase